MRTILMLVLATGFIACGGVDERGDDAPAVLDVPAVEGKREVSAQDSCTYRNTTCTSTRCEEDGVPSGYWGRITLSCYGPEGAYTRYVWFCGC